MPKIIKFDLPIDGIRAKNIEEIRDHFTLEILAHFRSGLLAKWLAVRKLSEELAAVQALDGLDDHAVLKGLCGAFGVEADDLIIAEALKEPAGQAGENVLEVAQHYAQLAEAIDSAIYEAVRTQGIVKNEAFRHYSWADGTARTDSCYKSKQLFKTRDSKSAPEGSIPVAPAVGNIIKIIEAFPCNYSCNPPNGYFVGWLLMSEYAEDYCSNWYNFIAVLNQRKQILSSMTEKVTIPLLKKALNDRVAWLEDIIALLKDNEIIALLKNNEKDFNAEQYMNNQEKDRPRKRNQEKLDIIRSLPAEKKAMISQPRTGQVSLKVERYGSENYKKGDLIYAHDKVGDVISTATGVISDIEKQEPDVTICGGFLFPRTHPAFGLLSNSYYVVKIDISN